jgi:uncharacterized protein (TIGR03083 family)
MEVKRHIDNLRREGELLATAVASTSPDLPVPTCPGWCVRDLVRHTGGIHRWAATHVHERRTELVVIDLPENLAGTLPSDAELVDWFREGHRNLVEVLERADPDLECYTFLPAPSPLAFWARRQAHETGIHRADAESASGPITSFAPETAADGLEELLTGFIARPRYRLRSDQPRTLAVRPRDVDSSWRIEIGPEGVRITRDTGTEGAGEPATCVLRAAASDLFLLLWNRISPDSPGIEVGGDATLSAPCQPPTSAAGRKAGGGSRSGSSPIPATLRCTTRLGLPVLAVRQLNGVAATRTMSGQTGQADSWSTVQACTRALIWQDTGSSDLVEASDGQGGRCGSPVAGVPLFCASGALAAGCRPLRGGRCPRTIGKRSRQARMSVLRGSEAERCTIRA